MSRTWVENDEILDRFRTWLTQTDADLDALDVEAESADADPAPADLPEIGLRQVVEALTAVRHEIKLETRSSRGLQDDVRAALTGLDKARQRFESAPAREQEAAHRAALPLVEALISLDEVLCRAAEAFEAAHRQLTVAAPRLLEDALDARFRQLPWWRRLMVGGWHRELRKQSSAAFAKSAGDEFAGLLQGYRLMQTRLERAFQQQDIHRIACLGRRVDPAEMTVVELRDDPEGEPETVVEEVRPGYRWGVEVVRFAEVRAIAHRPQKPGDSSDSQPPSKEGTATNGRAKSWWAFFSKWILFRKG